MQKKKAPPPVSDINVTPMVDVMLVLLIIFMVITPMLSKGTPVDMYKAKNPIAMQDADKEDAVIVAVTRDGRVFLAPGNTQTSADQLPQKVKDLIANRPTRQFISEPMFAPGMKKSRTSSTIFGLLVSTSWVCLPNRCRPTREPRRRPVAKPRLS